MCVCVCVCVCVCFTVVKYKEYAGVKRLKPISVQLSCTQYKWKIRYETRRWGGGGWGGEGGGRGGICEMQMRNALQHTLQHTYSEMHYSICEMQRVESGRTRGNFRQRTRHMALLRAGHAL